MQVVISGLRVDTQGLVDFLYFSHFIGLNNGIRMSNGNHRCPN